MTTFTRRVGRNLYACLLTEHEFKSEDNAETHQEQIIKRLQADGLLGESYSFGELDKAYRSRNAA